MQSEGDPSQVKEETEVMYYQEIDIKSKIVKQEPREADFLIKCEICKNFDTEMECVHHESNRLEDLEQSQLGQMHVSSFYPIDDVQMYSFNEDVKPEVEEYNCSSAREQDYSINKLFDRDIMVKEEYYFGSPKDLLMSKNFIECSTEQIEMEDDDDIFSEDGKTEVVEEEPTENANSINKDDSGSFKMSRRGFKKSSQRDDNHNTKMSWQCTFCSKQFSKNSQLVMHQRTHTKPFQCDFCSKSYSYKNGLVSHLRTHNTEEGVFFENTSRMDDTSSMTIATQNHSLKPGANLNMEKSFQCKLCSKIFSRNSQLVIHGNVCSKSFCYENGLELLPKSHTEEGPYQCRICSKRYFHVQALLSHEKIHTKNANKKKAHKKNKQWQCIVCSEVFLLRALMETHLRSHKGEKPFQCEVCLNKFSSSTSLATHQMTHSEEKPFECKVCLKYFHCRSRLVSHLRTHTGERPFKCEHCLKTFYCNDQLRDHRKIHTRDKKLQCKFCSRYFPRKFRLVIHQRRHTGEKPFQCKLCSKSFIQRVSLVLHEKWHQGENRKTCKVCLKSFRHSNSLITHSKIHQEHKPFQCKFCSKSFPQHADLAAHEGMHNGNPNTCKLCSKSFHNSSDLASHSLSHTGKKKRSQCRFCSKSFIQISNLVAHELTHDGSSDDSCLAGHKKIQSKKKTFQCKVCSKVFSGKSYLTRHENVHNK